MEFKKKLKEYIEVACKFRNKSKVSIYFIGSLIAKKFTPAAISLLLSSTLIDRIYNIALQYTKLFFEKALPINGISSIITILAWAILTILIFLLINSIISFITNFFKKQILEIKSMWQRSKERVFNELNQNNPREPFVPTERKIDTLSYNQAIKIIKDSAYGIEQKRKAIASGKIKETGGYLLKETYDSSFFSTKTKEVRIPTTEEKSEESKELLLYDLVFQEFYGQSTYVKSEIEITRSELEAFLSTKEQDLQKNLFGEI